MQTFSQVTDLSHKHTAYKDVRLSTWLSMITSDSRLTLSSLLFFLLLLIYLWHYFIWHSFERMEEAIIIQDVQTWGTNLGNMAWNYSWALTARINVLGSLLGTDFLWVKTMQVKVAIYHCNYNTYRIISSEESVAMQHWEHCTAAFLQYVQIKYDTHYPVGCHYYPILEIQ